jgi:hypothetical protein
MKTFTKMLILFLFLGGGAKANKTFSGIHSGNNIHSLNAREVQGDFNRQGLDEALYYYLPDWEIYYYVPDKQWIYYDGNTWVYSKIAPSWFQPGQVVYKVDLDYTGQTPFMYHMQNKAKYPARNLACGGPRYNPEKKLAKNVSFSPGNK